MWGLVMNLAPYIGIDRVSKVSVIPHTDRTHVWSDSIICFKDTECTGFMSFHQNAEKIVKEKLKKNLGVQKIEHLLKM